MVGERNEIVGRMIHTEQEIKLAYYGIKQEIKRAEAEIGSVGRFEVIDASIALERYKGMQSFVEMLFGANNGCERLIEIGRDNLAEEARLPKLTHDPSDRYGTEADFQYRRR